MDHGDRKDDENAIGDDIEDSLRNGDVVQTSAGTCGEWIARTREQNSEHKRIRKKRRANEVAAYPEGQRWVDPMVQNHNSKLG